MNASTNEAPKPTTLTVEITLFDEGYILGLLTTLKMDERVVALAVLSQ